MSQRNRSGGIGAKTTRASEAITERGQKDKGKKGKWKMENENEKWQKGKGKSEKAQVTTGFSPIRMIHAVGFGKVQASPDKLFVGNHSVIR